LFSRGLLSDDDIAHLVARGMLEGPPEAEPDVEEREPTDDHHLPDTEDFTPAITRGRGRTPRPKEITADELDRWIDTHLEQGSRDTHALLPIARAFEPIDDTTEAPRVLSSKSVDELEVALEPALIADRPSLDELWTALEWSHPPHPFGRA